MPNERCAWPMGLLFYLKIQMRYGDRGDHLAYVDRFLSHFDESRITEMWRGVYVAGGCVWPPPPPPVAGSLNSLTFYTFITIEFQQFSKQVNYRPLGTRGLAKRNRWTCISSIVGSEEEEGGVDLFKIPQFYYRPLPPPSPNTYLHPTPHPPPSTHNTCWSFYHVGQLFILPPLWSMADPEILEPGGRGPGAV